MSDLKPCPFCGGETKLREGINPDTQRPDGWWEIGCYKHIGDEDCPGFKHVSESKEATIGFWNRRAHDATETAALRALRSEMASVPPSNCAGYIGRWMSALDAILKERE